jgi:PAS domain S-box-containing protein
VIFATLILFFQLALENTDITYWQILLFGTSCAGCFYILFLIYYAKAQREKATILSEEKYHSIIAVSRMGAWEYHADTGYLWCSPEYFQMLGYDEKSFLQQYSMTIDDVWINMLHPDDRQAAVEKFTAYFSGERNDMYENTFRLKHKSGKWIWILARSKALNRQEGESNKVMLGTHIDITDKIAIQLELRRRNQKLMDFAFSNAHHVRGPVARMLGLVELEKVDKEKDRQWYLENICNEVQQLDEIIKSISRELDEINEVPSN